MQYNKKTKDLIKRYRCGGKFYSGGTFSDDGNETWGAWGNNPYTPTAPVNQNNVTMGGYAQSTPPVTGSPIQSLKPTSKSISPTAGQLGGIGMAGELVGTGIEYLGDSNPDKANIGADIAGGTLKGAGKGAGIGATIGTALAPMTFGLSIPAFAAIGAGIGGIAGGIGGGIKGSKEQKAIKEGKASEADLLAQQTALTNKQTQELNTYRATHNQNIPTFKKGGLITTHKIPGGKTHKGTTKSGHTPHNALGRYRRKYLTPRGMDIYAMGGSVYQNDIITPSFLDEENDNNMKQYAIGGRLGQSLNKGNMVSRYRLSGKEIKQPYDLVPLTEYHGNKHEQGGIPLNTSNSGFAKGGNVNTGAEVEDGETRVGDYINSDQNKIPGTKTTIAAKSKQIKNSYKMRENDKWASESLKRELDQLSTLNEMINSVNGNGEQEQMMENGSYLSQGATDGVSTSFGKGGFKLNPEHKGFCSPMTKSTCTGKRRQFAINAKNHFKKQAQGGDIYDDNEMVMFDGGGPYKVPSMLDAGNGEMLDLYTGNMSTDNTFTPSTLPVDKNIYYSNPKVGTELYRRNAEGNYDWSTDSGTTWSPMKAGTEKMGTTEYPLYGNPTSIPGSNTFTPSTLPVDKNIYYSNPKVGTELYRRNAEGNYDWSTDSGTTWSPMKAGTEKMGTTEYPSYGNPTSIPSKTITSIPGSSTSVTGNETLPSYVMPAKGLTTEMMPWYGYAAQGVGDIYDIYKGLKTPDYVDYDTVNYTDVKYDPVSYAKAIRAIMRTYDLGVAEAKNFIAQNSSGAGNLLSNYSSNVSTQRGAEAAGVATALETEANVNATGRNAMNQYNATNRLAVNTGNAEIKNKEKEINQLEKDSARSSVSAGLHGLSSLAGVYGQEYSKNKVQNSILPLLDSYNFKYTMDDKNQIHLDFEGKTTAEIKETVEALINGKD
jgi:hypothetical protein